MHVEVFAICDAASQSHGKINVLGAFDTIWAKKVPTELPHCAIAVRLRFNRIELGVHQINIQIVDQDGKLVLRLLDKKMIFHINKEEHTNTVNLVINMHRLKLQRFGAHSISLVINRRPMMSLPLFIKERQS